jgi:hypothetical protein
LQCGSLTEAWSEYAEYAYQQAVGRLDDKVLHRWRFDRWFGCGPADVSARLDERWGTNVWKPIIETPHD